MVEILHLVTLRTYWHMRTEYRRRGNMELRIYNHVVSLNMVSAYLYNNFAKKLKAVLAL